MIYTSTDVKRGSAGALQSTAESYYCIFHYLSLSCFWMEWRLLILTTSFLNMLLSLSTRSALATDVCRSSGIAAEFSTCTTPSERAVCYQQRSSPQCKPLLQLQASELDWRVFKDTQHDIWRKQLLPLPLFLAKPATPGCHMLGVSAIEQHGVVLAERRRLADLLLPDNGTTDTRCQQSLRPASASEQQYTRDRTLLDARVPWSQDSAARARGRTLQACCPQADQSKQDCPPWHALWVSWLARCPPVPPVASPFDQSCFLSSKHSDRALVAWFRDQKY